MTFLFEVVIHENHLMLRLLFLVSFLNVAVGQDSINIRDLPNKAVLIGELGKPLGTLVTIEGVYTLSSIEFIKNRPCIMVQKINDEFIQHRLQIIIEKYNFYDSLDLGVGGTYRLRVFETGSFVGTPRAVWDEMNINYPVGFHFINKVKVMTVESINKINWLPQDFLGREACLTGNAININDSAGIEYPDGILMLKETGKWPDYAVGKSAQVIGAVEQSNLDSTFSINTSSKSLINLEDQLGHKVQLRGRAWSHNCWWCFDYRGIKLHVEKMGKLPNWVVYNHGRTMVISGVLEEEILPSLSVISSNRKRDKKLYYIIKNPKWEPISGLLSGESKNE